MNDKKLFSQDEPYEMPWNKELSHTKNVIEQLINGNEIDRKGLPFKISILKGQIEWFLYIIPKLIFHIEELNQRVNEMKAETKYPDCAECNDEKVIDTEYGEYPCLDCQSDSAAGAGKECSPL